MLKKLFNVVDWAVFLAIGGAFGWVLAYSNYRDDIQSAESSLCQTAFLLTRKSSDTVAIVARQHGCVRLLNATNTNDPFPYDTIFSDGGPATKPVPR